MCDGRAVQQDRGTLGFGALVKRDDGSLTIFSLFIIVVVLMVGGLAVDFMRQETARVRMQSTLDRAVLAAASMEQTLSPQEVVDDYFAKAGLTNYKVSVTSSSTLNGKIVRASASQTLPSYFLQFVGRDTLKVPAVGTAQESISDIEISLVLDMSSSMLEAAAGGTGTKLDALKVAAKEFIDTIYAQADPDHTTISIVPYSTQVTVGANLLGTFNVTNEHSYSNCVDFEDSDFDTAALSVNNLLQRTAHFDVWSDYTKTHAASQRTCRIDADAGARITPFSFDPAALKAQIDALTAFGNTSIDIGVKWGAALLDPSTQAAIGGMVTQGRVDPNANGHPFAYDPENTLKVIVVMTDGANTQQFMMDSAHSKGASNVYMDTETGAVSILQTKLKDRGKFYRVTTNDWNNQPTGGSKAKVLSYPELWDKFNMQFVAVYQNVAVQDATWNTLWSWYTGNETVSGILTWPTVAQKNDRLDRVCTASKTAGTRIYTIGFQVEDANTSVLENCATSPSHFFRVEGVAISSAFSAIANDIGKLRLTN